jgi:hypothetical protein
MTLGILSLLLFCLWFVSAPAAILAVLLGIMVKRQPIDRIGSHNASMATVGIACGSVSLALIAFVFIFMSMGGLPAQPPQTPGEQPGELRDPPEQSPGRTAPQPPIDEPEFPVYHERRPVAMQ